MAGEEFDPFATWYSDGPQASKFHHRGTEAQRKEMTALRAKRIGCLLCASVPLW